MDTDTPGGLRLQPHTIPQLQQAYQQARDQLAPVLADVKDGFRINQPAMLDDASAGFQTAFNQYSAGVAGSIGQQVTAFEQRLRETVDKLTTIQQAYDRNETDTAAALSRQLEH